MTRKILLVEDNSSDEKLAVQAFKRTSVACDVVVARDGADALDYLFASGGHAERNARELPALVLLDLKLPKVAGLDVLRRIRQTEATRVLPVVVLTASREREDVIRSLELGANAYVRKPVGFAEFTEIARTIAVFWLTMNEACTS